MPGENIEKFQIILKNYNKVNIYINRNGKGMAEGDEWGLKQGTPLIYVIHGVRTRVTTNLHHTLNLPVSLMNLIVDKSISLLS